MAVFASLPPAILLSVPRTAQKISASRTLRHCLTLFSAFVLFAAGIIYCADFGYFFYHHQRIDATVLDFLENPLISLAMVWESYPVLLISIAFCIILYIWCRIYAALLQRYIFSPERTSFFVIRSCGTALLLFLAAYGQISSNLFPLRWSNAYFSTCNDLALLALNPIQNIRDTLHASRSIQISPQAVREHYDEMAEWLRIPAPNAADLEFSRSNNHSAMLKTSDGKPWNIVIVIMESLSWPKTSFAPGFGHGPTPNLKAVAEQSMYFPWFFAPTRTTARAIFTTMTGIPDVNRSGGTSSRNPSLVDQNILLDSFNDYEKYYMIGGSASWANIRGLLQHNISNLHLLEEGSWNAPNIDVWGISDLDLFREAVDVLSRSSAPFAAVIQTAAFHRPYTIPRDNAGFVPPHPDPSELAFYGFTGQDEYQSLAFFDHAFGEFLKKAKRTDWFNRTIFVFFGDHGLNDPSQNVTPGYLACRLQSNHVPMFIYAPGLAQRPETGYVPGIYPQPCGQPDIFPTIAALTGISYASYRGLGRNLLDPDIRRDARQFIGGNEEHHVRLLEDGYCFIREQHKGLYRISDPELKNLLNEESDRAIRMEKAADGMYRTSKYLLYHNRRKTSESSELKKIP
ncbi:MAG: LTA synthase family protein [Desulfovibrionaceae bacterium]|nr:LTA synthase family protein [Desulfovibrionaceae bacterium]